MKDCFVTRAYKGHYIHSYYDRGTQKRTVVQVQIGNEAPREVKSWLAAQMAITKHVKENGK